MSRQPSDLFAHLHRRVTGGIDRHGLDRETTEILGVTIPKVTVPIFPGKNNTVIAEVVALDFMLKTYGIDTAQDFNQRLLETMSAHGKTKQYLTHDRE